MAEPSLSPLFAGRGLFGPRVLGELIEGGTALTGLGGAAAERRDLLELL